MKENPGVTEFISGLKNEVLRHPVMSHPFWSRFREGRLAPRQLQTFGRHYYQHVKRTRLYAAAVLARTPYEEVQMAIASVLWDEYGQGDMNQTHPAQFRRLLRALNLTEAEGDRPDLLPELERYRDTQYRLCTEHDVWIGLGVVALAMELPIPALYEHLVEGFTKCGLKEDDLEFFIKHGPMDVNHANLLLESIFSHLGAGDNRGKLIDGARRSLNARFILMDGLYREVFE